MVEKGFDLSHPSCIVPCNQGAMTCATEIDLNAQQFHNLREGNDLILIHADLEANDVHELNEDALYLVLVLVICKNGEVVEVTRQR